MPAWELVRSKWMPSALAMKSSAPSAPMKPANEAHISVTCHSVG